MSTQFPIRGIIEGFYGAPWSHAQRIDMISEIAALGMNTFVYAPKDDALLRRAWRELYDGAALEAFAEIVESCRSHDIDPVFSVSPGLSMRYSDQDDYLRLVEKFRQVGTLGVTRFALLLDDIPSELQHAGDRDAFPSLAAAQVALIGRLYADLRAGGASGLIVAPTEYSGRGDSAYITALGRGIDPEIDLFWTGRAICSPELDAVDAERFFNATGHRPLYWDNFPVNDVAMTGELHIGPYLGRDPGLAELSRGVIANAMPLAEASKIAFSSIADYVSDPAGFDAESSWEAAVARVAGGDAVLVRDFADGFRGSALCTDDSPRLAAALARFSFAYELGDANAAVVELSREAARLASIAEAMPNIANATLAREMAPWIAQYARCAEGLALCSEVLAMSPVDDRDRDRIMEFLRDLRSHRLRVHGDLVDMFLSDTAHEFERVRPRDS